MKQAGPMMTMHGKFWLHFYFSYPLQQAEGPG
jgi:hypothetical protein